MTATTKDSVNCACEALAEIIVKLTEENVVDRQISLVPKECFAELECELKQRGVLLFTPSCRLIGPAAVLDSAQSTVDTAVSKLYARSLRDSAAATADGAQDGDAFTFHIPHAGLTVHVRQGLHCRLL